MARPFFRPSPGEQGERRGLAADRRRRLAMELFSIEACFVVFLVAGWIKNLGYLRSSPVDLTLLFGGATIGLVGAAMLSGRLRPVPPSLTHLGMILFTGFAVASLGWSSFHELNIDKAQRFFVLVSPSFFVADIIGRDPERRARFVRMLVWFCCAFLLYYVYCRYFLGVDLAARMDRHKQQDNYLQWGAAADYLFIPCLALAVLGPSKRFVVAALGCGAALYLLLIIGGRGPLAIALLAIPVLALGLLRHRARSLRRLALLGGLAAVAAVAYLALNPPDRASEQHAGGFRTLQRYESPLAGEDRSMHERFVGRQLAMQMWLERPVFGWGIGEFRIVDEYLQYPHNLLLEILAEMGLIGGFLFLSLCFPAVRAGVRILGDRAGTWTDATIALLFLADFPMRLTVEGYLSDDRLLFAFIGMAIGSGAAMARRNRLAAALPGPGPQQGRLGPFGAWVEQ
jgi:O-antigen ligase